VQIGRDIKLRTEWVKIININDDTTTTTTTTTNNNNNNNTSSAYTQLFRCIWDNIHNKSC